MLQIFGCCFGGFGVYPFVPFHPGKPLDFQSKTIYLSGIDTHIHRRLLLHGRCQCNQQATCAPWNLQLGHPPASQTGVVTGGNTGLMGRNLLCHSTCITSCLNSTFIFSECFLVPTLLLIRSHNDPGKHTEWVSSLPFSFGC